MFGGLGDFPLGDLAKQFGVGGPGGPGGGGNPFGQFGGKQQGSSSSDSSSSDAKKKAAKKAPPAKKEESTQSSDYSSYYYDYDSSGYDGYTDSYYTGSRTRPSTFARSRHPEDSLPTTYKRIACIRYVRPMVAYDYWGNPYVPPGPPGFQFPGCTDPYANGNAGDFPFSNRVLIMPSRDKPFYRPARPGDSFSDYFPRPSRRTIDRSPIMTRYIRDSSAKSNKAQGSRESASTDSSSPSIKPVGILKKS